MNPQYKRKGKTKAEILKENPDAFKKNKKEFYETDLKEIKRRLDIIENKIKFWENLSFWKNLSNLDVKGKWYSK